MDYLYCKYLIQFIYKYFIKYATYNRCQINTHNWCVKHPVAFVRIFIHSGSILMLNQSHTYTYQHFYKFSLSHIIKVSILSAARREGGRQQIDWFRAASNLRSLYSPECLCSEYKNCVFESVCESNIKNSYVFGSVGEPNIKITFWSVCASNITNYHVSRECSQTEYKN